MKLKIFFTIILFATIFLPCYALCTITGETIEDYMDLAKLYANSNNYANALVYIEMIEQFDTNNPKIIYEKAYILKKLNRLTQSEKTLKNLIGLNKDYACSPLAKAMDEYNNNRLCCTRK